MSQRYLTHDALNAIYQATWQMTEDTGEAAWSLSYLHRVQDEDLTLGVAMTDGKGDRSKRPGDQEVADSYVHITERRADGIVISGVKAIVTGGPYMHELLVMPCRTMPRKMPTLRFAVRSRLMPKGLRSFHDRRAGPARQMRISAPSTAKVRLCAILIRCWCPGIRYFSQESTNTPSIW